MQTTNILPSLRDRVSVVLRQASIVDMEIEQKLAQIPANKIWPKADFDAYIKKIIAECVPHYFSKQAVLTVLNAASKNTQLCEQLFTIALSADLKKCVDNRVRTFNDMQIAVEIAHTLGDHQALETDKSRALLTVLRQHYRNHLLNIFAEKTVGKIAELVEVELLFRYRLKNQLNLPCPVEQMLHWKYAEMIIAPGVAGTGEPDADKVTQVLLSAENFVLEQERDKETFALWLLNDMNWQTWIMSKAADDLAGIEDRLQQHIMALENAFNQLSDHEQDERLTAHAEQKQQVEEQYRQEKNELMYKQTIALIDQIVAQQTILS